MVGSSDILKMSISRLSTNIRERLGERAGKLWAKVGDGIVSKRADRASCPLSPAAQRRDAINNKPKSRLNLCCRHFASLLIPQRRLDGPKLQQEPNESAEIFEAIGYRDLCSHWNHAATDFADRRSKISAADILAGLPNRMSKVIAPHIADQPAHPALVAAGAIGSSGAPSPRLSRI